MPTTYFIPDELIDIPHWTTFRPNKAPDIEVNMPEKALTYKAAIKNKKDIGFILSHLNDIVGIDIDFPGTKAEKQDAMLCAKECGFIPEKYGTQAYADWLRENYTVLQQLDGTPLEPLLQSTFVEFSPSGFGLHIWVHMQDKPKNANYKKSRADGIKGQASLSNCFLTTTGRPYPGCSKTLATIPYSLIVEALNLDGMPFGTEKGKSASTAESDALDLFSQQADAGRITFEQVQGALSSVPCDLSKKVQKTWERLTHQKYEHYTFWINIGMALHDYGIKNEKVTEAYILWLEWSKQDAANFKEEELDKHWRSFDASPRGITIATLLAMESLLKFEYPRRTPDKKNGGMTALPMVNEYVNFKYLMDYYNIKIWDAEHYYLSGDDEVMQRYFNKSKLPLLGRFYGPLNVKELEARMLVLCQDSNWRGVRDVNILTKTWMSTEIKDLDVFKEWLDTPFNDLPEELRKTYTANEEHYVNKFDKQSTVDFLFTCMNAQYKNEEERKLYFTLFKKTLMQMIKFREPDVLKTPFIDNGGMLILTGPENAYKSTFCKQLLPRALEDLRTEIKSKKMEGDKAIRDFIRYFATKTIVQLDDCDDALDLSSSFFKNILSGNDMSFTDIYATQDTKRPRKAIAISTTNKNKMVLSSEGTRRLWFIPVGKMDTASMVCINHHKLYNDLRKEFRAQFKQGIMPWLLSQEEIDMLNTRNEAYSAKNDIDMMLEETWPTNDETMPRDYVDVDVSRDKTGKFMTSFQVRCILTQAYGQLKITSLEHALKRFCTKWTGIKPGDKKVDKTREVCDGKIHQNWNTEQQRFKHVKWIMPPRRDSED